jgi:hypothetical protein
MLMCCGSRIIATSAGKYNFGAALPGIPAFRLPNPEPALPAALSLEIQIFSPYHDVVWTFPWPIDLLPNLLPEDFLSVGQNNGTAGSVSAADQSVCEVGFDANRVSTTRV